MYVAVFTASHVNAPSRLQGAQPHRQPAYNRFIALLLGYVLEQVLRAHRAGQTIGKVWDNPACNSAETQQHDGGRQEALADRAFVGVTYIP